MSEIPERYRGLSFREVIAETIRQEWEELEAASEVIGRHLAQFPPADVEGDQ
jgi:hypothetical protein